MTIYLQVFKIAPDMSIILLTDLSIIVQDDNMPQ